MPEFENEWELPDAWACSRHDVANLESNRAWREISAFLVERLEAVKNIILVQEMDDRTTQFYRGVAAHIVDTLGLPELIDETLTKEDTENA